MVNMDISDTLISFETAKLAKEKGFIIPTLCYFRYDEKQCKGDLLDWNEDVGFYSRPTQSLLQKWLRDTHNIYLIVIPSYTDDNLLKSKYYFEISHIRKLKQFHGDFKTYEEALEEGLKTALNLLP